MPSLREQQWIYAKATDPNLNRAAQLVDIAARASGGIQFVPDQLLYNLATQMERKLGIAQPYLRDPMGFMAEFRTGRDQDGDGWFGMADMEYILRRHA